jgi:hypothetical protein
MSWLSILLLVLAIVNIVAVAVTWEVCNDFDWVLIDKDSNLGQIFVIVLLFLPLSLVAYILRTKPSFCFFRSLRNLLNYKPFNKDEK